MKFQSQGTIDDDDTPYGDSSPLANEQKAADEDCGSNGYSTASTENGVSYSSKHVTRLRSVVRINNSTLGEPVEGTKRNCAGKARRAKHGLRWQIQSWRANCVFDEMRNNWQSTDCAGKYNHGEPIAFLAKCETMDNKLCVLTR